MDCFPATAPNALQTVAATLSARRLGLRRAAVAALSALVLSASTMLAQQPLVASADVSSLLAAPAPMTESAFEQQMVDLVNQDRAVNGLAPVNFDSSLLDTARQRAADQIPQPSLNHWDADGQLAFVKDLAAEGVTYSLAGENLARLSGLDDGTALRAEDALMHSPTHRANILEPTFSHIAVGATMDDSGRVILAQIFSAN